MPNIEQSFTPNNSQSDKINPAQPRITPHNPFYDWLFWLTKTTSFASIELLETFSQDAKNATGPLSPFRSKGFRGETVAEKAYDIRHAEN
jgi:hypothetical protein